MAFVVQNTLPWARGVDTKIFASKNLVKPQTVRKGYSINGAYLGVVPTKLANGRLLWPDVIVTKRDGAIAANDEILMDQGDVLPMPPSMPLYPSA
ncbi:hypothetical protein LMG19087_02903 [Ralstonia wenshanensis]|uniref:hypothetical protein n=1 Tax=Ralstonia wenshanensis TaxID=2842456 RepID=UPI0028F4D015|nr:hypothetical protein [Ralstonia wenshanensis]CAJ0816868.1 hypothetical protein LMG19087_02903 [Ralstonia wenshanensis]